MFGTVQERLAKVLTYLDGKAEQLKRDAREGEGTVTNGEEGPSSM